MFVCRFLSESKGEEYLVKYKDLLFEALAALTPLACASDRLIGWRPLLDLSIAVLFIEFLGMSRHCQSIVRVLLVFKKTQPNPLNCYL